MKLEKIPFKNGNEPSISEETLEQLQENIDKAINTHPIIKMQIDRQNLVTSGSYGEAKIPLNVKSLEIDNEKDYLLVGNNEIIIGENVNLVEITAHTRGISYYETKGDKEFKLMHNSSNIGGFFQKDGIGYWGAGVTTKIVVNKGDRISLSLQCQVPGDTEILEGFLQVEVIK